MRALRVETPVGLVTLVGGERGLRGVLWSGDARGDGTRDGTHPVLQRAAGELDEYFAGRRRTFDLPLDLVGTPFQLRVWRALSEIPYGTRVSYRELARRIGRPDAPRAVGAANGRNPISIVVPCHRVVGADGALTGYGGGLDVKAWLLALEGAP